MSTPPRESRFPCRLAVHLHLEGATFETTAVELSLQGALVLAEPMEDLSTAPHDCRVILRPGQTDSIQLEAKVVRQARARLPLEAEHGEVSVWQPGLAVHFNQLSTSQHLALVQLLGELEER